MEWIPLEKLSSSQCYDLIDETPYGNESEVYLSHLSDIEPEDFVEQFVWFGLSRSGLFG